MTKDETLMMALEALETAWYHVGTFCPTDEAIDLYDEARAAIKEALAQQEPQIAFNAEVIGYVAPQRTWVHLTNQEHDEIAIACGCLSADWVFYGAVLERKIKEKNT